MYRDSTWSTVCRSAHFSYCLITGTSGKGEKGERRILGTLGGPTRAVSQIKAFRLPAFVVGIQDRSRGRVAHPCSATFVISASGRRRHLLNSAECHANRLGKLP